MKIKNYINFVHNDRTVDLKIPIKCENCALSFGKFNELNNHLNSVHEKKIAKCIRIASLNIGRGLIGKEEQLKNTIYELKCDICCVSECDLVDFDESKPFSIEGFKTLFPLKRSGSGTKRLHCFFN